MALTAVWVGAAVLAILILGYSGAPPWGWLLAAVGLLVWAEAPLWLFVVAAALTLVFSRGPVRRTLLSRPLLRLITKQKLFPKISDTERAALDAGDLWLEKEYFSGKPDFGRIRKAPYATLTSEENAFLDGPVEKVCAMVDDWQTWKRRDLSPEVWAFLKRERFFGMIIPKSYGGLGFSAMGHSEAILKMASRSVALSTTVMVPNSLGPAKLLIEYGTDAQKRHYLPRLATGEEMPCFALTEPEAGSDAGSLRSEGVLFRDAEGKLMIRLNWNKRWITLAAIATVMGLAFRLKDPEHLLGGVEDLGITCALVPTHLAGVTIERRHDPLGVPFFNSPTQGHDVVIPADAIIGGLAKAGHGWSMLMEALADGRGISLPAESTGLAELVGRVTSAYVVVRRQFGKAIGSFAGVAEPLARIGGFTYGMEAFRRLLCSALDAGKRPAIATAIAKYQSTELARKIINDGMDILGGRGISLGPRNLLAHYYIGTPITITVEGANILTRTLIIFGQGAMRAHPYSYREVRAAEEGNLVQFDWAFWGHAGHFIRNFFRATLLAVTRGRLALPFARGEVSAWYRKLAWASASFAFLSDVAMVTIGAELKAREKLTGRFADMLSWMMWGGAILRRFEAEGRRREDWPVALWAIRQALSEAQAARLGILECLPLLKLAPFRWFAGMSAFARPPGEKEEAVLARLLQTPGEQRERLFGGVFMPPAGQELARLETAFLAQVEAREIERKLRHALGRHERGDLPTLLLKARQRGLVTELEAERLLRAEKLRQEVIQVDDFSLGDYLRAAV